LDLGMASYALEAKRSDWGALMPHCDVGGAAVLIVDTLRRLAAQ
jgi:hypothetical protein